EASQAPEGVFLKSNPHPRAYGNFARVLGKYARDEKVITLPEAVRRLSALPATNLGLDHRGFIQEGMFADVVVFDPATIADRATFEKPHQYAVGMKHVLVNGVLTVLSMLPMSFPDKRAALLGAFFNRFAIGFVVILIDIPCSGWLIGLSIGILLSLPPAIITKAFAPILGIGAVGGVIIGLIRAKFVV